MSLNVTMCRCISKQTLIIQRLWLLYVNSAHIIEMLQKLLPPEEEEAGDRANR